MKRSLNVYALYAIIGIQIIANAFTYIYTTRALALDPCATAAPGSTSSPTAKTPSATNATATPPAPTFAFTGSLKRSLERNNLVIYAQIQGKNGQLLDGYKVKFTHDGSAVPVQTVSTPYSWGFAHPPITIGGNVTNDATQGEPYNYKAAFDIITVGSWFSPVGQWTLTLLDKDGKPVSADNSFTVTVGDEYMEIYATFTQN